MFAYCFAVTEKFEDKIDPEMERPVGQPVLQMRNLQGQEFSLEN